MKYRHELKHEITTLELLTLLTRLKAAATTPLPTSRPAILTAHCRISPTAKAAVGTKLPTATVKTALPQTAGTERRTAAPSVPPPSSSPPQAH